MGNPKFSTPSGCLSPPLNCVDLRETFSKKKGERRTEKEKFGELFSFSPGDVIRLTGLREIVRGNKFF